MALFLDTILLRVSAACALGTIISRIRDHVIEAYLSAESMGQKAIICHRTQDSRVVASSHRCSELRASVTP